MKPSQLITVSVMFLMMTACQPPGGSGGSSTSNTTEKSPAPLKLSIKEAALLEGSQNISIVDRAILSKSVLEAAYTGVDAKSMRTDLLTSKLALFGGAAVSGAFAVAFHMRASEIETGIMFLRSLESRFGDSSPYKGLQHSFREMAEGALNKKGLFRDFHTNDVRDGLGKGAASKQQKQAKDEFNRLWRETKKFKVPQHELTPLTSEMELSRRQALAFRAAEGAAIVATVAFSTAIAVKYYKLKKELKVSEIYLEDLNADGMEDYFMKTEEGKSDLLLMPNDQLRSYLEEHPKVAQFLIDWEASELKMAKKVQNL